MISKYLNFTEINTTTSILSLLIKNRTNFNFDKVNICVYLNNALIELNLYQDCRNLVVLDNKKQAELFLKGKEAFLLQITIPSCIIEHIYKFEIRSYFIDSNYNDYTTDTMFNKYIQLGFMENKVSYIKNNLSSLLLNYKNIMLSIIKEVNDYLNISFDLAYYLYLFSFLFLLVIVSISQITEMFVDQSLSSFYFIIGQLIWVVLSLILSLSKTIGSRFIGLLIFLTSSSYIILSFVFHLPVTFSSLMLYYSENKFFDLCWIFCFYLSQIMISYFSFQKIIM